MVSGFIGGLPVTQVIVRTSTNLNAGGKTKLAAVTHGVLIAVSVMTIASAMNYIPYASLAAVLIVVGYKLAKPKMLIGVFKEGWQEFVPFAVTIVCVVRFDLLTGVACGLGVAILIAVIQRLRLSDIRKTKVTLNEHESSGHYHLELPDFTSFAKKSAMIKALNEVPDNSKVNIDLSNVQVLASDIKETIDEFHGTAKAKNISVHVTPQAQEIE